MKYFCLYGLFGACLLAASMALAEDWPVYRHDIRRSGVTPEAINVSSLKKAWEYRAPVPPQQAWHGPAKWDAFSGKNNLRSMRNYDPVFFTIAVGENVFLGSSVEDAVLCLDAETGREKWRFITDGPVRMAPAHDGGKLYFGADDGVAYCLEGTTGALVWKFRPGPEQFLPNDGKLISRWPIRSGVLVDKGTAYFGAGLFPWTEAYLCAVDANSGKPEGEGRYRKILQGVTIEGALLASPECLYVPQGRAAPMMFRRTDGADLGMLKEAGGVFALLTPENQVVFAAEDQKENYIALRDAKSGEKVASYAEGICMLVHQDRAYVLQENELFAINRTDGSKAWSAACECPYALILAGEVLLAGGNNNVDAFSIKDGAALASLPVPGRAYGLTVANTRLLISTDTGAVCCFK